MNYKNTISKINRMFDSSEKERPAPQKVDSILSSLTTVELGQMHRDLTDQALSGIYHMLSSIEISTEAKEHIIYKYYISLTEQHEELNREIFLQIINEFKKTKYLALESLIVYLLKEDKINENDLALLKDIGTVVIKKEGYATMMRTKIRRGEIFTEDDVNQLLKLEQYNILESALDNNLVDYHALRLFQSPEEGARNKKHKKVLFLKATQLLNNR